MSEILCAHCHLPCPSKGAIKLEQPQPLYFCCHGCQQVFLLLHSLNLETFYDKLDKGTLSPVTPAPSYDEARYTSKPFLQTFATPLENGDLEVALLLENIHCSACIWLIERVLLKQEGIQSVQINYTTHRAYVIFDPNATHIPHILNTIASIGYSASIYDPNTQDKRAKKEHESHYIALVVGIFSTMNVMWIAIASYAGYFSGMDSSMAFKLHIASWILSSLTLFITGAGFFRGAFYGLKHGFLGMDLGVSLGALGTYLYSIYALFKGLEPYFESVSMIITFVFISKFLELKAKIRANSVLDGLQSSLPVQVLLLKEIEGEIQRVLVSPEE
ncbi:heavy metal translocating P-type ATPase metal-binding domain-containing protein, partial [Helicobacter bizzozeronii]|uniref:heavy metal translocating P-type ATPase metal-binding domain-containing protein n=1 Tax=Helicobacter bizzozeronii TaxID=56877 RepID=UPI0018F8342D